ncbi:ATP-binding protein [Melioribacter sp. OK-1-Me]|uniref:ATP-binding protein n=1 Tax=Melioribacter sp. OK-1-Me TaxID=3461410 RepID=UPI0040450B53
MQLLIFLLQQSSKSPLDSSLRSLEEIGPESLFSAENPYFYAILLMAVILVVSFMFFWYVVLPMQKRHEKEEKTMQLRQAELMALFVSLAPDPVFRVDKASNIILANDAAHKVFPFKVLLGTKISEVLPFTKDLDIYEMIKRDITINYTTQINQNYFQFKISGISSLEICQIYGRDITELKRSEKELQEALRKAEESQKLKEFFLSQISHEVRSPLNVIIGFSNMLLEEAKSSKDSDMKDIYLSIINNSKRLYRTFDLLLNMSQIQTGSFNIRFEHIDVLPIIKSITNEFATYAEEKNVALRIVPKTEDTIVTADHYSVSQIFSHLIDNAIKYSENGNVDIILRRDENYFYVDVKDNGIGIPPEYIGKLFTPFSQANMSYSKPFEGTGLGLALVKNLLDINNAKIEVKSELGTGSIFTVIFEGNSYGRTRSKKT